MVFIIGGNGFVGSAYVRYCIDNAVPYTIITRENYHDHIGAKCSVLINANGNSKKYIADQNELEDFDASVRTVRSALIDFEYDIYVQLSSCDVYPDCGVNEDTIESFNIDVSKLSRYGFHKYLAESCVMHRASNWLIFRMGGFVGPGLRKNAIYDILKGGKLWVKPESCLQYMHTDDAAKIVFKLIDMNIRNQIINLAGYGVIRVSDITGMLGRKITVDDDSKQVLYNISTDKLSKYIRVPSTKKVVELFINEYS